MVDYNTNMEFAYLGRPALTSVGFEWWGPGSIPIWTNLEDETF